MYRRRPSAALAEAASLAAALSSAGWPIEVLLRAFAMSLTATSLTFSTLVVADMVMEGGGVDWEYDGRKHTLESDSEGGLG